MLSRQRLLSTDFSSGFPSIMFFPFAAVGIVFFKVTNVIKLYQLL